MTEPVNTPPNLFMVPADWTEGELYDKGGDSPPTWWSPPPTFEDVGFWKFDGTPSAYPHTIIYTGTDILPVGQAVFNWTIEESSTIPFWFLYRFDPTTPWTIVPFTGSTGDSGSISVFLPGGLDLGQNPPFDDADDPVPAYFEWGIINALELPGGSLPVDVNEIMLLHFDGTNGGTVIKDSSLNNYTGFVCLNGGETVDIPIKFGVGSLAMPGSSTSSNTMVTGPLVPGSYLDILPGAGDYTIEGWFYLSPSGTGEAYLFAYGDQVTGGYASGVSGITLVATYTRLQLISDITAWSDSNVTYNVAITDSAWHHFAAVRHGGVTQLYLDGVGSGSPSNFMQGDFTTPAPAAITFGWTVNAEEATIPFYLDEVRVSNRAQYTANFTPPTAAFDNPADPVWFEGQVNVSAYSDQFNCECDSDNSNYATLAELRTRMMYRLGYAAMANNPPPGMVGLLNEFLSSAQKLLYRSYKELRTERFYHWTMGVGQRYYGIMDNEDGCLRTIDPYKITWVGFQDLNEAWYPLVQGIDPIMYTRAQITVGWPTNYEIRSCIEIFPAPRAAYTLWLKGHFGLDPLVADDDRTTIDDEAVFQMALGNAKAHYRQPDSSSVLSQALGYVRQLVAGSHGTARYVPRTRVQNPMTPPRFLPLEE